MIEILIKAIVLAVVLFVVYYLVTLIVTALGLPNIVALIIGILLALGFLLWVLKAFGISL